MTRSRSAPTLGTLSREIPEPSHKTYSPAWKPAVKPENVVSRRARTAETALNGAAVMPGPAPHRSSLGGPPIGWYGDAPNLTGGQNAPQILPDGATPGARHLPLGVGKTV